MKNLLAVCIAIAANRKAVNSDNMLRFIEPVRLDIKHSPVKGIHKAEAAVPERLFSCPNIRR